MGQPNRSRRWIAAGLSRIDTMDRRSERRNYRNRDDNCENFQSCKSTSSAAPVEIVVHRTTPREAGINATAGSRFRQGSLAVV